MFASRRRRGVQPSPEMFDWVPTLYAAQVGVSEIALLIGASPDIEPQCTQTEASSDNRADTHPGSHNQRGCEQGRSTGNRATDQSCDCRITARDLLRLIETYDTSRTEELAITVAGLIRALVLLLAFTHACATLVAEVDPAFRAPVCTSIEPPPAGRTLLDTATTLDFAHERASAKACCRTWIYTAGLRPR